MRKIAIAEYSNYVNENGVPKGHGKKSLHEAHEILSSYRVNIHVISAKEYFNTSKGEHTFIQKIVRKEDNKVVRTLKVMNNIRKTIKSTKKDEVIWFTNTDWMLFAYMGIFHFKRRIVATVFRNIYEDTLSEKWGHMSWILSKIVSKGLSKLDLALVTNANLECPFVKRQIYIPDYYYQSKYDKYRTMKKENCIVCLGLMHRDKDVKGIIEHFGNCEIPIKIIGDFQDEEYYAEVKDLVTQNIWIENRRVSDMEYCELLGTSKYVILPYSAKQYVNATSGILLETIFMNSVPIAPNFLLDNNSINGIGYDVISEIPRDIKELNDMALGVSNSIEKYQFEMVAKKVVEALRNY